MMDRPSETASPYLLRQLRQPRSLREACRQVGLDHRGMRCPDCPLRDLCESDVRWLVKLPPRRLADL
jgi:hypothetical protein